MGRFISPPGYHQAVIRGLVAFVCVGILLAGAAAACGAPAADIANPNSPPAQATNVRRTEVAAAEHIRANNPTPTLTAEPTLAAPPTCQAQDAIWWYESRAHVGESRTVQGTIVATRAAPDGLAMLEIGQPYPDPTGLAVLIPVAQGSPTLDGKSVCVVGRIALVEGRLAIQLRDPSNLRVMN
jgi:hypothetical protein